MSFTIRGNIGGPNALIDWNDENDAGRQAALRLSLGLRVHYQNSAPPREPASDGKYIAPVLAEGRCPEQDPIGQANADAARTDMAALESAARLEAFAGLRAPETAPGVAQYPAGRRASAYDLAPLAFYAALKIG